MDETKTKTRKPRAKKSKAPMVVGPEANDHDEEETSAASESDPEWSRKPLEDQSEGPRAVDQLAAYCLELLEGMVSRCQAGEAIGLGDLREAKVLLRVYILEQFQ